jgi:hypothetical protein
LTVDYLLDNPRPKYSPVKRRATMARMIHIIVCAALAVTVLNGLAQARQPQEQPKPPPFATTKVEGTDNVYVFRYANAQAMFVVTKDGVIATDPIGYGRPQGGNDLCCGNDLC